MKRATEVLKVLAVAAALAWGCRSAWAQQAVPDANSAAGVEAVASEPNGPAAAPYENGTGRVRIRLNFQEAPLQTILEYLSQTVGLVITSTEGITDGPMTVISRQSITLDEALALINSVLKERDLTTVRKGRVLKVTTLDQARLEGGTPVITRDDLDDTEGGDDLVVCVIPIGHVTASGLARNLMALLPEYATIETNDDSNTLIVTDTTSNIKRLLQIIDTLDLHMSSVAEIEVFRLVNAEATSVANLINSIFQQQAQAGRARQTGRGSAVDMIMQRGGPGGDMAGMLSGTQTSSSGGRGQVVAAADSRTNSVVVRGPADALAVVRTMIASLDDRRAEVAQVRVIQLRYADALNVANVVNQLFGTTNTSRNQGGPQAIFERGGRGGQGGFEMMQPQEQSEGNTLAITAAADSQTNTVVVTGPEALLVVVEEVIYGLDKQIPNVADVQVFHLEYADATNVASLVNEIFGVNNTSSNSSRGQQNQQVQFGGRGGFAQQTSQTSGTTASDAAVLASADTRTNTVVVTGPPEIMATIAEVIEDLDQNPEQERQIFVYPLKNATATNLVTILNNMFTEMRSLNQQGTGRTGTQQFQGAGGGVATTAGSTTSGNDLSEEIYFEADATTNSLLVMTSTKNYEKIKPIIDQLDKPVGQVLIKVLFAEITHSNSVDLGTEFSVWNLRGGGPDNNFAAGTAFGGPAGGITAAVFDQDLEITIRALQETGKLNILSRPYILTSNQQEATMTVGQEVPFATGSTTSDSGSTVITTEYRNVGISLAVTPSINPEGLVILTVNPEISSTTGDTVRVSEDLSLPVFATRSSVTKVAVRDGQTIVIGGLIQDEIRDSVSKVPLLGDLPLLGQAFRRNHKEKIKTELLIFLTPHVAADADALLPISEAERARSNLYTDESIAETFQQHMIGMGGAQYAEPTEPNLP